MGLTKRIWIEQDPEYEAYRQAVRAEISIDFEVKSKLYTFRLPGNRFEVVAGKRRKDRLWDVSLSQALKELDADCIWINEGVFFRTVAELEQVKTRAEQYRAEGWERLSGTSSEPPKPTDASIPICPECSWPMKKRRARQGFYAGQKFWGCMRYPVCKGTRDID